MTRQRKYSSQHSTAVYEWLPQAAVNHTSTSTSRAVKLVRTECIRKATAKAQADGLAGKVHTSLYLYLYEVQYLAKSKPGRQDAEQ